MKNKIRKFVSDNFTLISFLLAIYIVLSLIQWYESVVNTQITEVARREMLESVEQLDIAIEEIVDEGEDDLSLLADYIVKADITSENIVEFLNNQSQVEEFDLLYYILPDGSAYSRNGAEPNLSDNAIFLNALENDTTISTPYLSDENGNFVFNIAIPIKENNKTTAVLFSEVSMDGFYDIMDKLARGNGWVFFLDHSLNTIFSNSNIHSSSPHIPEYGIAEMGSDNIKNALEDIQKEKSGSFLFEIMGKQKILVYMPITATNWVLAVSVVVDDITVDLHAAVDKIQAVAFVIMFIFLVLTVYTWLTKTSLLRTVEKSAYYDPLTGLPNLLKLKKDMKSILVDNHDKQYSILIFDIVNFKVINEMFGYDMGDRVLKVIKGFKDSLDEPSLIVARVGSDEFAFFAESFFLEDVDILVKKCFAYYDVQIPELISHAATFKCGRYKIEANEVDVDSIVNKVKLAHSIAKSTKGQGLCEYDEQFKKQLVLEAELTDRVQDALQNEEFVVYLQPKFNIKNNKLVGAEALIRWMNPDETIISPSVFISLFEKNGFILYLDEYVLNISCETIARWIKNGIEPVPISVNCSRINLGNLNLVEDIIRVVDSYNIPRNLIDIELTESVMIGNEDIMETLLKDLHKAGFKVSIDDFGAGYSSLGMLKNFEADTIKLDKSFFDDNKAQVRSNQIIDGIIKLAHKLNMEVVAEGVETVEQVEMLTDIGCDIVQGFYFSKPITISEFKKKYHNEA